MNEDHINDKELMDEFEEWYGKTRSDVLPGQGFMATTIQISKWWINKIRELLEPAEIQLEDLDNIAVTCGVCEGMKKGFVGGCGEAIPVLRIYACVDCSAPFHRKCLLKHVQKEMVGLSLTKMPLEDAFKKIDELTNETQK